MFFWRENDLEQHLTFLQSTTTDIPVGDLFLQKIRDIFDPIMSIFLDLGTLETLEKYEQIGLDPIGYVQGDMKFKYRDTNTNKIVVLKTLKLQMDELDGESDESEIGVPCTTIREVSLMKVMEQENIARLLHVEYEHDENLVHLVFEYPGMTLTEFMEKAGEKASDLMLIKKLLYQLLRGVSYYHSVKAVHGSLNSTNVLIDSTNDSLKIINLELSVKHPNKAPEQLLGSTEPTLTADMFSVGCIFGEMVSKKPLFSGGDDDAQLCSIFNLLGTPTEENWPGVTELYPKLTEYEEILPKEFEEVFPGLDKDGIDLLSKLLCLDPSKRIAAADALKHTYFKDV